MLDPTKGIRGFFQSVFKPGEKKSEKKDPLAEKIKQEKKEFPKLSFTHKFKKEEKGFKESNISKSVFAFLKKPKAEVKGEAIPLYNNEAEQRELLLRNITVTFETLLEKMEGQEKLPVGLFRIPASDLQNVPFKEALNAGNKNKIDSMLRSQFQAANNPEVEFHQIVDFASVCARYINDHPELFQDEKDKAALRESLKPLGQIVKKIIQNYESTKMDWDNIYKVSGQSVIKVCRTYGIDLPKPLPKIPDQKSPQDVPSKSEDVPKEPRVIPNKKGERPKGMRINPNDIQGQS